MSSRTTTIKIPQHPKGHEFAGSYGGYKIWNAGFMRYEITKGDSFEVVGSLANSEHFLDVVDRIKEREAGQ